MFEFFLGLVIGMALGATVALRTASEHIGRLVKELAAKGNQQ